MEWIGSDQNRDSNEKDWFWIYSECSGVVLPYSIQFVGLMHWRYNNVVEENWIKCFQSKLPHRERETITRYVQQHASHRVVVYLCAIHLLSYIDFAILCEFVFKMSCFVFQLKKKTALRSRTALVTYWEAVDLVQCFLESENEITFQ